MVETVMGAVPGNLAMRVAEAGRGCRNGRSISACSKRWRNQPKRTTSMRKIIKLLLMLMRSSASNIPGP